MNTRIIVLFAFVLLIGNFLSFEAGARENGQEQKYDVVIYGGTSAGITAAVQVKKMGKTVVVVAPELHLGGLTAGGLGYTDSGNTQVIGGLSREFYRRVYQVYQDEKTWRWQKVSDYANYGQGTRAMLHDDKTMWIFEPHVAEQVFESWVAELEIPVVRNASLDREKGVRKEANRIVSFTTLCGKTFHGRVFLDATYEGDLMAAAKIEYHVGREANSQYGEMFNGNQVGVLPRGHLFPDKVDPYVVPGDPASGRLKYVDDCEPGVHGEADHRVQAYCFRLCMTDHEPNRVPFSKPEGYDPSDYELLIRAFDAGFQGFFNKFDRIPNCKTDTNNHGAMSMDFIGMNYDYPEASYENRREIIEEHKRYQMGLLYFVSTDPRIPQDVQEKIKRWGLAADEFTETDNWPHQIYVRESRRMVGEYVTTELDCNNERQCPKSVGMGSYNLDSHNVRRYVTAQGYVQNEGDIQVRPKRGPYSIDYGSIVPKREQCVNLIVPVCVSSSHIAFGSIRMEPVFMILGQSAATAAVFAIQENIDVQAVDYEKLKQRLEEDGQRLTYQREIGSSGVASQSLPGIVMDSDSATKTGDWISSAASPKYVDFGYLHDGNTQKGEKNVIFEIQLPNPGQYEVRLAYAANANRASNVPVEIVHRDGTETQKIDQRKKPPIDEIFISLGTFSFEDSAKIVVANRDTDGHVIIDAVQILPVQ